MLTTRIRKGNLLMTTSRKRDGTEPTQHNKVGRYLEAQIAYHTPSRQRDKQHFWKRIHSVLKSSTLTPEFLPSPLRRQAIGYLLAILLPLLVVLVVKYLAEATFVLHFYSSPVMLVVLLISLGWGALPGLLATISGATALGIFILPHQDSFTLQRNEDTYSMVMLFLVGLGIILLSRRVQRARQQALQAQGEAEAARANLYRVLMQAPIPISVLRGPEHRYELLNPYAWETLDQRDALGKPIREILPAYEEHVLPMLDQVYTTGEGRSISEHRVFLGQQNGGTQIEQYYNVVYQPIRTSDDKVDGVIVLGVDVTEQVQARRKIEHLLAEMDNFISIVAHELRTPVTAAKLSSQMSLRMAKRMFTIQPQIESQERVELLTAIQRNLHRTIDQLELQNRLVGDLLDASRVRADHLELRLECYNLAQSITNCVEDQRNLHPKRHISLSLPTTDDVLVSADPERVQQVVANYLDNALKYSDEEKPVAVEVSLREKEIYVAVHDKGPGLNEEQKKRIWERFYRAPGVHVRSGSGMSLGLGLCICRSIIEHHGGRVGVTSIPGEGSTFWFTLPRSQQASDNAKTDNTTGKNTVNLHS